MTYTEAKKLIGKKIVINDNIKHKMFGTGVILGLVHLFNEYYFNVEITEQNKKNVRICIWSNSPRLKLCKEDYGVE